MCGTKVYQARCSSQGVFPPRRNATSITLISKGDTQESMWNWRPIASCNVLYKVVAKVLANWLKLALNKYMLDNQSTLFPKDLLLIMLWQPYQDQTEKLRVTLKLDISKAYDRIDWDYLRDIMIKMNFLSNELNGHAMCGNSHCLSTMVQYDLLS